MMMSSAQCWKKFCYHNIKVSSWLILIFHKLDTAETNSRTRQQLMQLLACRVCINQSSSNWALVTSGVPQGSV